MTALRNTDWKGTSSIRRRYNAREWLTGIGDMGSPTGFAAGYAYNADGNVKADTSNPKGDAAFARSYSYDALDRLQSADYGGDGLCGPYDLSGLRYDRNGNIEEVTRQGQNGEAVDNLDYSYQGNRLTSTSDAVADTSRHGWDPGSGSFAYDAAGRMLRAPAPTGLEAASYNRQGLPEAMALKGGKILRYWYSASGQRTYKKLEGQGATHYVRDGATTVAVLEGSSLQYWTLTLPGGETIGRVKTDGSRRYYVKDHLGSVRAVLGGSGSVKETRDYYPFGLPMPGRYDKGSPPTKEDFTGHVKDNSTGLHYAGARYYTAAFGRWTTTDPILGEKGPKALLKQDSRLLTMTSYNYAFDNPLRLTDPTGLAPMDWYRDEEGNIVHDEDVQSQADLEEGQTYLGENVLKYQEDGPTKLLTEGGDRVNVFDKGASKAEQGSKGASGLSVAAARQEAVLTSKWAKGGKSLSSLVEWTGRIAKGGTVASFLLSTGSEVAQGDMRTYEFVKGTVDAGLAYGSYYYGAGAAASFALEVTPAGNGMTAKERGIRFLTRQILEAQVDKVVSQ